MNFIFLPKTIKLGLTVIISAGCISAFGQRYQLVWSDDFENEGKADTSRWVYKTGDGCPDLCGWGAGEQQIYTDSEENSRVESGYLVVEAKKNEMGFTSAMVTTKDKGDWQYGKIEVRARLPQGGGSRALIWMLPYVEGREGRWPDDGQIDIMDHSGDEIDVVHGMAHSKAYNRVDGTERRGHIQLSAIDRRFHNFSIEWTPTKMEWFVDGKRYHKMVDDGTGSEGWPFNNRFYLLLSLSVGGSWVEGGISDAAWPQKMEIDFVRVYQRKQKKRQQGQEEFGPDDLY